METSVTDLNAKQRDGLNMAFVPQYILYFRGNHGKECLRNRCQMKRA